MADMITSYAFALLEFAGREGMDKVYHQALLLAEGEEPPAPGEVPPPLGEFLQLLPQEHVLGVLRRFVVLARNGMDLLPVEIFTAVPLTEEQLNRLEVKLIRMFRRQLEITAAVDPSLLGGVRVIAGGSILDDTVKRKLRDMKRAIYKEVYLKHDHQSG